jgi:hypothetical protein
MSQQRVHLVQRVGMKIAAFSEQPAFYRSEGEEGTDAVPVRVFTDPAAAGVCRDQLEREARSAMPPVLFMAYQLPVPASQMMSFLRELGLEPPDLGPDAGSRNFQQQREQLALLREWWSLHAASLTPEKWEPLWERLFPDWRFYEVVEVVLEG